MRVSAFVYVFLHEYCDRLECRKPALDGAESHEPKGSGNRLAGF